MENLVAVPRRPDGVNQRVVKDYTRSFVVANAYTAGQNKILSNTTDDVEIEVSFRAYDNMERDSTIMKSKRILVTSVLSDELQMAPGATEEHVGADEFEVYVQIQELCERMVRGIDRPFREVIEQLFGNAIKYGHGIAETEWEYRLDVPSSKPPKDPAPKGKLSALFSGFSNWWKGGITSDNKAPADPASGAIKKPILKGEKLRLMPKSIKVKPRNSTRFVVDDYMNTVGLVPYNKAKAGLSFDEIVDRTKFMVLTLNKQDEDPRGKSMYRTAFNWVNLKTQLPAEMMRFILEESAPKSVGTLPPDMPPFEFERDEDGNILYEDPGTNKQPKMLTGAESFKRQMEGFRSGSGAVIPHGATLEPYKKGLTGSGDAEIFSKIIKIIDDQMEEAILLQTLAQSEGEHQARSASQQVAEVLYNLVFWIRWQLAMMTMYDFLKVGITINVGEWAVKYMPMISFGDFTRRDWVEQLMALADAYFKGFIDDSQRAELMAWLNLPKPGTSRQELAAQQAEDAAKAQHDVNGNPIQPANNRPDKKGGNRNTGNGTEKKRNAKNTGFGPSDAMGHNAGWFRFS
jgi:hypothetical protein